ncbi:ferredoxin [Streptomyces sp. SID8361]|uniref:ferredoxin n=1 Tax=Streptomyces sp. MnatMP-M27 TaxID=1839768 RepID=UPI00081E30BC|nr:ferredoxin [Streptomyces sp. MnatMP-M27]MYU12627.1 ferredoxin [Streptomyces sp. SID8361]SCF93534.1 ferredoxin [Streptomyces sp. MnatMP-M27]
MVNHENATRWRVAVDPGRCIGSGTCLALAPHLFRHGADDVTEVAAAETPAESAVLDSAACCPSQAITVTDAATGTPLHPGQ